ncbi:LOW QUALITY PROTEIN: neuronal acetylcholine receptor subunit non-alpha-2-like [Haliotis rubra]|uniref:LOW QUALITY PROTEIN: neuronal acetylcholine receptor subunit non-alpha-2-like n=1 Tax=Haliotis rubra TaxID=36100 RepID=UPI001EE5AD74|nr:LOW QUALITY PROTEIN: neuronal acetylcholine receptor subunit non-alpha-2-like [Haliotis rubra]
MCCVTPRVLHTYREETSRVSVGEMTAVAGPSSHALSQVETPKSPFANGNGRLESITQLHAAAVNGDKPTLTRLVAVMYCVSVVRSQQAFSQDEYNLRMMKLGPGSNYSHIVRPSRQVQTQIRFNLLTINDLNTRGQTMTTTGWLTVKWTDPRLQWTPASHGNVTYLFDTEKVIWRPEVVIDNALIKFHFPVLRACSCVIHLLLSLSELMQIGVIEDDDLLIRVKHTGEVTWEPPGLFSTSCDIDVTYYPFDRQACTIELTSWSYNIHEVNLTQLSSEVFSGDFSENGEWDLKSTSVTPKTLVEAEGTFSQLDFTLHLQRRVTYYILSIILPIALTSILSVITFTLPFESGEKVSYALTVLLSYAVLMLLVSENIHTTSITVSVLGIYLALILFVGASTTVITVINIHLFHKRSKPPVSKTARAFVSTVLLNMAGWKTPEQRVQKASSSSKVKIVPYEDTEMNQNPSKRQADKPGTEAFSKDASFYSWQEIALMSDIMWFRVYAVFVVLVTIVFMICLPLGGHLNYV